MKKILCVIFIATFAMLGIGQEQQLRLSMAPFDDTSSGENISATATSLLTQLLSNNNNIYFRQPDAIKNYIDLLEQVQVGLLEPAVLKGKTNTLAIDYLCVGSIGKIANLYQVDARIVDVNSWKIISSASIQASNINSGVNEVAEHFSSLTLQTIQQDNEQAKEAPTVGIHEFREHFENPPTSLYCTTFMEMLTSALADKTKNNVIETKFTSHLLEEKSFEMAGIIENSKADQAFSIQGVEYRTIGNIRVFPDLIVVNYNVVNTASQKIVFTGSVDVVNPTSLRAIASYIAKIIDDALNNKIGNILIKTIPVDADIYINDSFAGTTKDKKLLLIAQKGNNTITAKAQGCKAVTLQVECIPKKTKEVLIKIERITERLLQEAMIFESNGKYTQAIERYDEFIKETGNTTEANVALYRKGHILLKNIQDLEKAKEAFTQLLNNYPEPLIRTEGYFGLAQTFVAMGNKEQAKATINYLLEHYPESNAAIQAKDLMPSLEK
jgi:TolA-binding protein/TolB-like protein